MVPDRPSLQRCLKKTFTQKGLKNEDDKMKLEKKEMERRKKKRKKKIIQSSQRATMKQIMQSSFLFRIIPPLYIFCDRKRKKHTSRRHVGFFLRLKESRGRKASCMHTYHFYGLCGISFLFYITRTTGRSFERMCVSWWRFSFSLFLFLYCRNAFA